MSDGGRMPKEYKAQWNRDKRAEPEFKIKERLLNQAYYWRNRDARLLQIRFWRRKIKISLAECREMIANGTVEPYLLGSNSMCGQVSNLSI